MSDADVDGAHIRTLLLTLFYRYFRPVVEAGHLYIAQPPLYGIQQGKEIRYAFDEAARDKILEEIKAKKASKKKAKEEAEEIVAEEDAESEEGGHSEIPGVKIQRYKGLGEMNAEQLWSTTMDPEHRIMKQVDIDDAEEADRLFDILMGDEVEPRKQFIQAHAATVQNLDI
jgi:DNA gyrase subunit B